MYKEVGYKGTKLLVDTELKQLMDERGKIWYYNPDLESKIARTVSRFSAADSDLNCSFDFEEVKGSLVGRCEGKKYRRVTLNGKSIFISRLVWLLHNGGILEQGMVVDHRDLNPLNDNIDNLRAITNAQNLQNKSRYKKSGSITQTDTVGVRLEAGDTGAMKYKARWWDSEGRNRSKSFSVNKYGYEEAYKLACEARRTAILELNELHGKSYTESHM